MLHTEVTYEIAVGGEERWDKLTEWSRVVSRLHPATWEHKKVTT